MQAQKDIDFSKIKWSKITREKAEFIYNEAIARLDSIHRNNDIITNKAIGMLSFSLPILAALTGYFILQIKELSTPLLAMSICAGVFLFAILVLLLLILLPRGINSAQGEPSAYFTDNYYLSSMLNILKGNIQTLHQYIKEDGTIQRERANLFNAAVVLFAIFPIISAGVWAVLSLY
ncbi:MAG: hypothetical protein LBI28_12600 [Treponema sp.]|jgi:hypothetical protein|nr:hypothetical protein [Treponema sp.]